MGLHFVISLVVRAAMQQINGEEIGGMALAALKPNGALK